MIDIKTIEEFYDVVESEERVIVYFYTKWCPDCYSVKPFLTILEEEYKQIHFYSFDRDNSIELAKHLEIFGIPSFIIFQNGDEVSRYVDKARKSYTQVKEFIEKSL